MFIVIFISSCYFLIINVWFLFSALGLLQTLTDMLCKELGKDDLKLNSKVLSLSYSSDGKSALENWTVACGSASDKHSKALPVDAVIMTVSTHIFNVCLFHVLWKASK